MDVGQKVRVLRSIDKGQEGEIIGTYTKLVPPEGLKVGGDDAPIPYCKVRLDETHTKLFPQDWVEAIND